MSEANATAPAATQASKRKIKINKSDLPDAQMKKVILRVNEALDKSHVEKDVSTYIKKKCDEELGGTWHCVCGRNFGCSITHDTKYVLFFQVDQMHILLFKSLE